MALQDQYSDSDMKYTTKEDPEGLTNSPSYLGEVSEEHTIAQDAVFGEITDKGPNYRNVSPAPNHHHNHQKHYS